MQNSLATCLILFFVQIAYSSGYQNGFIPNRGQWPNQVRFAMDVPAGKVFLESDAITYTFYDASLLEKIHHHENDRHLTDPIQHHAVRMKLLDALPSSPLAQQAGLTKYNYFYGKEKNKWVGGLHAHKEVRYPEIFSHTDMLVYTHPNGLKYDFILHPGGKPSAIQWKYEGANSLKLKAGNLIIKTSLGEFIEMKPLAWQNTPEGRIPVECNFSLNKGIVAFDIGEFNPLLDLTIDPQVVFATYSGSGSDNWGFTATYDEAGNGYSGGIVFGVDFPTQTGAYQVNFDGGQIDIGILKYNTNGTQALYVTYLGGSDIELPHSLIVNEFNELIVFGTTGSADFPVTAGAYKTTFSGGPATTFENGFISVANGCDIFVSRFSVDGSELLASTFAGGSHNDGFNSSANLVFNYADEIRGSVWVDSDNHIYVGTSTLSNDISTSSGVFQPQFGGGTQDGVIFKFEGNLNELIWASYIGGTGDDGIYYLHVDSKKNIVVTGGTNSSDFPTHPNAFQSQYGGQIDGFVSRIDSNGTTLIGSTYIGSELYDQSYISGSDRNANVYLFGQTSAGGMEFIQNSGIAVPGGNQFITKLDPSLQTRIWSTTFGNATGTPDISPTALLVDVCDKIYISGWGGIVNPLGTSTTGLLVTQDAFQSTTDGNDFYLYVVDNTVQNIEYASFLGGASSYDHVDGGTSRFDRRGIIYQSICAGCGGFDDLPVTPGAFSPTNNASNCNNALVKFDFETPLTISSFINNNDPIGCAPYTVNFSSNSSNTDTYSWRLGNSEIGTSENLEYTFTEGGTYEVILISSSQFSCNLTDTASLTLTVIGDIETSLDSLSGCIGSEIMLGPNDLNDPYYTFQWSPDAGMNDNTAAQPTITIEGNVLYKLIVTLEQCSDTLYQQVTALGGSRSRLDSLSACLYDTVQIGLSEPYFEGAEYTWFPNENLSNSEIYNPEFYTEGDAELELIINLPAGCIDTLDLYISARTEPFDIGPDLNVCAGQAVSVGIQDSLSQFSYSWSPGDFLNDSTRANPIAIVESTTEFNVIRIPQNDTLACPGEATQLLNVVDKPEANLNVEISLACDGISLQIVDSSAGYNELELTLNGNYLSDTIATWIEFPYADSLTVIQIAINGLCRDTFEYSTYIKPLDEYYSENSSNAFSPNGDGINDCFSPALFIENNEVNTYFLPCSDLYIYDRWGRLMFSSLEADSNSCWDGNDPQGNACDEGVFNYIYRFKETEKAGSVHLRR
jgi:gliding motility-associated-like protein